MKSLRDYIRESSDNQEDACKTFEFDFSQYEGAKEKIKMIQDAAESSEIACEVIEDSKIKISLCEEEKTKAMGLLQIIETYIKEQGKAMKRSASEAYGQFCQKQERLLDEFKTYINTESTQPEEDPENKDGDGDDSNEKDEQE
jgi:hypothetical protein